jgi:acyl-CoA thioesterase-2
MTETVTDVLTLLELDELGGGAFRGRQPDTPNHHIVGGQLAAQALMAAGRTVQRRSPHSLHAHFLRRGDARESVDFAVDGLHDGGTFSTREVTASQGGAALMKVMASFTADVDAVSYQPARPAAIAPEDLRSVEEQLEPYAAELGGWFVRRRPFDTRYVDPPPRVAMDLPGEREATIRIWLRARGVVPRDPLVGACLLTYLTALVLLEPALGPMGRSPTDVSALLDHAVWFHEPVDFADWLFFEQHSASGIGGRARATGTMFNRRGDLACTAGQTVYFPKRR